MGAKITVSDRQKGLGTYKIQPLQCLKLWLKIDVSIDHHDDDQLLHKEIIKGSEGRDAIGID